MVDFYATVRKWKSKPLVSFRKTWSCQCVDGCGNQGGCDDIQEGRLLLDGLLTISSRYRR